MEEQTVFDPSNVDLDSANPAQIICYLFAPSNEYNGSLSGRISSIFVILVVSTAATMFPVLATHSKRLRIPLYVYLFARYFGTGVIISTAFIHLLVPADLELGPTTCVGMTGNWATHIWPPALVLVAIMAIFLLDFLADYYVKSKYGYECEGASPDILDLITNQKSGARSGPRSSGDDDEAANAEPRDTKEEFSKLADFESLYATPADLDRAFRTQIAALIILEFGIIFHSVIIGLNLGVAGDEFKTLYIVIVFHQAFEGLGIGARLSGIPFPARLRWMPWALCLAYGLTTPIAIAIGLGARSTYLIGSFTGNIVSGILDSISAGILIYTGLVEMLARDFIYNPKRTNDKKRLTFMMVSLYLGAGIMALLGKWA